MRRQWERSGLLPIAERVLSGQRLAGEEWEQLAKAELPLLAKLVECKRGGPRPSRPGLALVSTPDGRSGSAIVEAGHPEAADAAVQGASRVVCRQELRSEPGYRPGLPQRFLQELRRWEAWCRSVDVARTWTLVLPAPLETGPIGDAQPLGEEVLRAIAVAALILPNDVEIQAPVADLGIKTAQVALDFGATHLGPLAADRQTAQSRGLPQLQDVQRVLNLARPTPVDSSNPASFPRGGVSKRHHSPETRQP